MQQENKSGKLIIEEYYKKEADDLSSDFEGLINDLIEKKKIILLNHFLDISHKTLAKNKPLFIFNVSIFSNHKAAQKLSFQYIKFNYEYELIDFIEKFPNVIIHKEIESANKPLASFIKFFKSNSKIELTNDCKSFLKENSGIVQSLVVKFLIYQHYQKKISNNELIEILNSFQWTEISALLIKGFIEESDFTGKVILEKLNTIFNTHFNVLGIQNFDKKAFLDNFKIKSILNLCDGRKHYNELIEK